MASDSDIEAYLHQLNRKTQSLSRDKDEGSQSDSESMLVDKPLAVKDHNSLHSSKIDSLSDIRALSEKYRSRQPKGHISHATSDVTDRKGKDAARKKNQDEIESKNDAENFYGSTVAHNEKALQWLKKPVSMPLYAKEMRNDSGREEDSVKGYEVCDDRNIDSTLDEEQTQNFEEAHLSTFDKQSSEESSDSDEEIIKLANVMTFDDVIGTLDENDDTPRVKNDVTSQSYSVEVDGNVESERSKDVSRSEVDGNLHSRFQREGTKPGKKIICKNAENHFKSIHEKPSEDAKHILFSGNGTVDSPFYKKENKNDHKEKSDTQLSKSPIIFFAKNREGDSSKIKKDKRNVTYENGSSYEVISELTDEADVIESIAESISSFKEKGDQHGKPGQMDEEDEMVNSIQTVKTDCVPQQFCSRGTQKTFNEGEKLNEKIMNDTGKKKTKSTKAEENEKDRTRKGKKQKPSHLRKKLKESSSKDSSESDTLSSSETSESESSHVCRRRRRRRRRRKGRHDRLYKKVGETAPLSRYIFTPVSYEGMHFVFPPGMIALEEVLKQQVGLTRQFINCHQAMYQEYTAALSSSHRYTTMKQIEKYIKKKKKKPLSFEEAFDVVKKEMSTKERHNPRHSS